MDHSPANFCVLIGLMLPSLSIVLLGPSPTSVLTGMSSDMQVAMCACIFSGLAVKVHGALSHTRWWFPRTTLRRCYQLGYTGAPIAVGGLLVYGFYILSNTPTALSALGAVLTPFLGLGIGLQAVVYWLESRRIENNERALIREAKEAKGTQT